MPEPYHNTAAGGWTQSLHPLNGSSDLRIPLCPLRKLPGRNIPEPRGIEGDKVTIIDCSTSRYYEPRVLVQRKAKKKKKENYLSK